SNRLTSSWSFPIRITDGRYMRTRVSARPSSPASPIERLGKEDCRNSRRSARVRPWLSMISKSILRGFVVMGRSSFRSTAGGTALGTPGLAQGAGHGRNELRIDFLLLDQGESTGRIGALHVGLVGMLTDDDYLRVGRQRLDLCGAPDAIGMGKRVVQEDDARTPLAHHFVCANAVAGFPDAQAR